MVTLAVEFQMTL